MSFELTLPFLRPMEPLFLDDSISEVMSNPDSSLWYERDGIVRWQDAVSLDAARLRSSLELIAKPLGKRLDEDNPVLHAQLPDCSRFTAVIPPVIRRAQLATIHASSAAKALFRFANLVMRSYEQATLTDAEAEIGEAVEFIIQTERRPGRRVVREVLRLKGYDRRAKQFLFESICEVDHATA
jgi:pilus assembly protein CpaF